MSSRTDLRVSRALALLADLRAVLADFAKREDALLRSEEHTSELSHG